MRPFAWCFLGLPVHLHPSHHRCLQCCYRMSHHRRNRHRCRGWYGMFDMKKMGLEGVRRRNRHRCQRMKKLRWLSKKKACQFKVFHDLFLVWIVVIHKG